MYSKEVLIMGTVTVSGGMIIIIAWITLIEFDQYPESKRMRIMNKIITSPDYLMLAALMPVGIILNTYGSFLNNFWLATSGTALIFLQGMIIAFLFWNRKRWKSILLFFIIGLTSLTYLITFLLLS